MLKTAYQPERHTTLHLEQQSNASLLTHQLPVWIICIFVSIYPQQEDKIKSLVDAAGIKVEPYWPSLFAKLLQNVNVDDLINNIGAAPAAGAGGAGAGGAAGGADGGDAAAEEKKEESEESEEEEEDMDFDLFD